MVKALAQSAVIGRETNHGPSKEEKQFVFLLKVLRFLGRQRDLASAALLADAACEAGTPSLRTGATDGLAAAMCHYYQTKNPVKASTTKNWEDFIRKNPGRIAGK